MVQYKSEISTAYGIESGTVAEDQLYVSDKLLDDLVMIEMHST